MWRSSPLSDGTITVVFIIWEHPQKHQIMRGFISYTTAPTTTSWRTHCPAGEPLLFPDRTDVPELNHLTSIGALANSCIRFACLLHWQLQEIFKAAGGLLSQSLREGATRTSISLYCPFLSKYWLLICKSLRLAIKKGRKCYILSSTTVRRTLKLIIKALAE